MTLTNFFPKAPKRPVFRANILGCALFLAVTACGPTPEINDPYEPQNRGIHSFNLAADRAVLAPLSRSLGNGTGPIGQGISNFSDNLGVPGDVLNSLLQFRIGKVTENTLRFAINTVGGLGGLFDPATAMGLHGKKTDFGETLYVWGVGEGAYLEVPLLGPSTQRDLVGTVVDIVIDPLNHLVQKPESYVGTAAKVAARIGDRGRYSGTIESILYDSADSYAQSRLLYLQNRRYELGQTTGEGAGFVDPYEEDPYGQ